MKKYHLMILFLLMPVCGFGQAKYNRADSTTVTSAATQFYLPAGNISHFTLVNKSTTQTLFVGMTLGSSTTTPDTGSSKRIYVEPGDVWSLDPGVSPSIIWVRSRAGTVGIRYEMH